MNEIEVTIRGTVTSDVALRTTAGGKPYARFTVATAQRVFDRTANSWSDGETSFLTVKCWGALAQNVADSFAKGLPAVVHGRLNSHRYERDLGDRTIQATSWEITAYCVGHDLNRGVAEFRRAKSQAVQRAEDRALAEAGMTPAANGTWQPVGGGGA